MSRFFDNWAWAHRNARAWVMVVALGGMLAWTLWETSTERLERREVSGTLVEIRGADDPTNKALVIGRIRLADGTQVRLMMPQGRPLPKVGDQVPLIYERYDDGSQYYFFNAAF